MKSLILTIIVLLTFQSAQGQKLPQELVIAEQMMIDNVLYTNLEPSNQISNILETFNSVQLTFSWDFITYKISY